MPSGILVTLICEANSHNLFKSVSSPYLGTNQHLCHIRNHGCDPCGVGTHDPRLQGRHLNQIGYRSPLSRGLRRETLLREPKLIRKRRRSNRNRV